MDGSSIGPGTERPLFLPSDGGELFGILHQRAEARGREGLIFLNPGPQNRAGPQRIYVKTARRFGELGVSSLRIDLPGVGDSEGEKRGTDFDCFDPADVSRAVDFATQELDWQRVVLLGTCAGARVAVKAASRDRRVAAVIAWSMPVISSALLESPDKAKSAMTSAAARGFLRHWAPMLLRPDRWRKYLGSAGALREGFGKVRRVVSGLVGSDGDALSPVRREFLRGMDRYLASDRPALFAYGERDTTPLTEFQHRFGRIAGGRDDLRTLLTVRDGDHTFTSIAAEAGVIEGTAEWLTNLR